MRIPNPFIPLRVTTDDLNHKVDIIDRSYTFGADGMITSIISKGKELLSAPMRIVMEEDGKESVFDNDYHNNESESFIQSRSDERAVICGAKQSERFIINFTNTIEYDGNIDIDFKLMTRGLTVAQVFGVGEIEPLKFKMDKLWLEIPLKKQFFTHYHMHRNGNFYMKDGSIKEETSTSMSGRLPSDSFSVPYKTLLWMGNEELGLGWFTENDRHWQPIEENRAMEFIYGDDTITLRIRLLDSHPKKWTGDTKEGSSIFNPIDFHFGFQATPVKPFPKNPYIHKAFHIDCGIKIKGNYMDFFSQENRFDRLKEKGVDTLILHEKWNKSQNWFELSEFTSKQLRFIVDECHKRGIKVLPYFGYELSTMASVWSDMNVNANMVTEEGRKGGGWWRVPFQRDYNLCFRGSYRDIFVKGLENLIDTYHLDGIYLDSTAFPRFCFNTEHGCGWYDEDGRLHGSHAIKAVRKMFQELYCMVKARGGVINVHTYGVVNFLALPYIDQTWYGENLQHEFMKGSTKDMDLDYFRAEYIGRNVGVPVEFIAYENRPLWNFENALSCSILHGILPRPNNIDLPLDLMSNVWKIFDKFPVELSEWKPYWDNTAATDNKKVKVSYYKYTNLKGEDELLAFVVNTSAQQFDAVTVSFEENVFSVFDAERKLDTGFTFPLKPYQYRILFVK